MSETIPTLTRVTPQMLREIILKRQDQATLRNLRVRCVITDRF